MEEKSSKSTRVCRKINIDHETNRFFIIYRDRDQIHRISLECVDEKISISNRILGWQFIDIEIRPIDEISSKLWSNLSNKIHGNGLKLVDEDSPKLIRICRRIIIEIKSGRSRLIRSNRDLIDLKKFIKIDVNIFTNNHQS